MPRERFPCSIDRRGFLRLTAIAGGALAAGACVGRSSRGARPESNSTGARIVVSNHPLYIDAATNPGFTAATGTVVEYHEDIVDEDAWLAALGTGRDARLLRDVVIVSDWVAATLSARHLLAPDDPPSGSAAPVRPPVVWAQGMVGIAYDAARVDALAGRDLRTIAELFRPPLHGRVALPADPRLTLGMALLADGIDPSDPTSATLAAIDATAGRLVNSVRLGQVLPIDGTSGLAPIEQLVNGDVDAAVVRASDVVGLEHEHPDLRFVVPDEGGLLLTDVAVVSFDSGNPVGARAYLDYISDAEHAAERYRALPVLWPPGPVDDILRNDTAPPEGASTVRAVDDPRRNPPADVRARLRSFRLLDATEEPQVRAAFDRVIHG